MTYGFHLTADGVNRSSSEVKAIRDGFHLAKRMDYLARRIVKAIADGFSGLS